jgi:hypothetical protein
MARALLNVPARDGRDQHGKINISSGVRRGLDALVYLEPPLLRFGTDPDQENMAPLDNLDLVLVGGRTRSTDISTSPYVSFRHAHRRDGLLCLRPLCKVLPPLQGDI